MLNEKSIANAYPELVKEWDYEKNGTLTPEQVLYGSGKKVWWRCSAKKHSYDSSPNNRTNKVKQRGCPYCSGQKVCIDNCLSTTKPDLAKEWHPTLNGDLTPEHVTEGSNKKVYWICSDKKHAYKESPKVRSRMNTGCPYCSNYRINDENCLATTHPETASEWHPSKNKGLTPNDIVAGYRKNVHWLCENGHDYPASPKNRTGVNKTGCPFCSGRFALPETCLANMYPDIAKEWHETKNGLLTPNDVLPASNKDVWWVCVKGHEYLSKPASRVLKNSGCPFCSNKKVSTDNSLAILFPDLLDEWDYEKNLLSPYEVVPGREAKVWWVCRKKHSYDASPYSRTTAKTGCPYCSNKKVCIDNCLSTINPEVAKELHPTKNGNLTGFDILSGSVKKVWWLCPVSPEHEWKATPSIRTRLLKPSGCPYCSNQRVCSDNCMATTHPELAKEWHPTKNGTLTPIDVIAGSNKGFWWLCAKGHEWKASGNARSTGNKSGCPKCKKNRGEERIFEVLTILKIDFLTQHKFTDCRHKRSLPFDFAVLNKGELIALVEYDGIQHFEEVKAWGGKKGLELTQKKDRIKNEYCKKNNIPLIRIPYTEFDKIEERLVEELRKLDINVLSTLIS